ncbi:phosphate ABC transporter permease PstA, partial [Eubacterium aggregans]
GAIMTIGILAFLVLYILIMGVPNLSLDLFAFKYTTENVSLFPALVNTIIMIAVTLIIAVPLGIGSAIFLEEYAKRGNPLVKLVAITTETLSAIPSIVYGLFGMLFFVTTLGWGYSMLAGSCTMAIMILPLIMRTTQEALKAVPDTYREGSFGLGAGRLRTVFRIILPAASPGIFAGIVLAVGRIVGETAVLIYTAGTVAQIPPNLMGSGRTLAIHMYALWSEGLNTGQSYATAVVLLVIVILLNLLSDKIAQKIASGGN